MAGKIAIIGALQEEVAPYIERLEGAMESDIAKLRVYEGSFHGIPVLVTACGMGKVNAAIAAQLLISIYGAQEIWVSGCAGSLDSGLNNGNICIAETVVYHDLDGSIISDYHPHHRDAVFYADPRLLDRARRVMGTRASYGLIATGDVFVAGDGRQPIIDCFGAICVDMETAAIAHVCYVNEIPFLAVRGISDGAESDGWSTFEQNLEHVARLTAGAVTEILTA